MLLTVKVSGEIDYILVSQAVVIYFANTNGIIFGGWIWHGR